MLTSRDQEASQSFRCFFFFSALLCFFYKKTIPVIDLSGIKVTCFISDTYLNI